MAMILINDSGVHSQTDMAVAFANSDQHDVAWMWHFTLCDIKKFNKKELQQLLRFWATAIHRGGNWCLGENFKRVYNGHEYAAFNIKHDKCTTALDPLSFLLFGVMVPGGYTMWFRSAERRDSARETMQSAIHSA